MASSDQQHQRIPLASFPIDCPQCSRQVPHTYGLTREYLNLFVLSVPKRSPWVYVECAECKLIRRVARPDRKKLDPLTRKKAVAFDAKYQGSIDTSLGKVCDDPARIRLYYGRAMGRTTRTILRVLILTLLILIGSVLFKHSRTLYQDICHVRGWQIAHKAEALFEQEQYRAALRHMNRAQRWFHQANQPYDRVATLIIVGHLKIRLQDFAGAIKAYEKSLRLSQEAGLCCIDRYALEGMGVAYERMGDRAAALEAYKAAEDMLTERHDEETKEFLRQRIGQMDDMLTGWLDNA